jgi:sugar phosphate isomerase/epimerase
MAVAGATLSWLDSAVVASENRGGKPMKICIFSKHLQWLDYEGMARTSREIGFDGVDLTVRPGGHVLPERVREDLPRAIHAVKVEALVVPMMTTAITDPSDPLTGSILAAASQAGIRYYRMGYYRYDDSRTIHQTLSDAKAKLRDLVDMNKHYNIVGAYQNHAGAKYVGAPLWDLDYLFKDIDTRWIGCQFDIRHATVEGGTVWPTHFRLMSQYINTLVAKDFKWAHSDKGWRAQNCPLGEGMVDFPRYFKMLKQAGIVVPMSLHLEYPIGGAEHGARRLSGDKQQVIEAMRKDLRFLRKITEPMT